MPPLYVLLGAVGVFLVLLTLRYPVVGLSLLPLSVAWGENLPGLPGGLVTPTDAIVGALGIAWLVSSLGRTRPASPRIWTPYVLLFLAAIALSTTQAADLRASAREMIKWAELAVVYLAAAHFVCTRAHLRVIVAALVVAGVSQALLGYAQFALSAGPAAFAEHRLFLRAYGSFDQPNPYAGYLNMSLPLALGMAALGPARRRRTYALAALALAGAVVLSQSRGGMLAGTGACVVIAAIVWRRVRPALGLGAMAAAIGAWLASLGVVPTGPFERILTAVGLGNISFGSVNDANFSAIERAAHWLAGVRMFAAHPLLGVGIGNYSAAYPAYHPRGWYASLEHAHNYYINIAAEGGIIGLVAYVLLAGTALWYSYSAIRRAPDRLSRAAALGVLGALIATDLHNLFDVLYVHGMVALLGLLMALVPVISRGIDDAD